MAKFLEFEGVSFSYHSLENETPALDNITFSLEREEFVAIVGPSGSGKTTILSLLAGLLEPSSGSIRIDEKTLKEARGIASLMPQRDQLFEWRSIIRNVTLGLEINHTNTADNKKYAMSLLKKYGLGEFLKKRPSELSGGMRQRAALIRTLVTSPEILLLDEPFSALDFQTRLNVCNDVYGIIKEEKKTAVFVTHDISEAISMADKIIVLTERPASIKKIVEINLNKSITPLHRREEPGFAGYFKLIWDELEADNDRRT